MRLKDKSVFSLMYIEYTLHKQHFNQRVVWNIDYLPMRKSLELGQRV